MGKNVLKSDFLLLSLTKIVILFPGGVKFLSLLWLTQDDFTRQGASSGAVKERKEEY